MILIFTNLVATLIKFRYDNYVGLTRQKQTYNTQSPCDAEVQLMNPFSLLDHKWLVNKVKKWVMCHLLITSGRVFAEFKC